jgi:hypothetical protein
MSVIERKECPQHGADRMLGHRCRVMERPYVICNREGVIVEYVPADQLAGAVEALREIVKVDHIDAVLDPARPLRIAKAWLREHDEGQP